jgi:AraC-like DNA-binding protein
MTRPSNIERQSVATPLYRSFATVVAPTCHRILRYAVDHIAEPRTVEDAARDMGADRKTLNNRLNRAGHPPVSEFLTWVRVAAAVELLSESKRPASCIAAELGFSTGPALRAAFDRYLGVTTERARSMTLDEVVGELHPARILTGRSRVRARDTGAARTMHLAPYDGERHERSRCGAPA